MENTNFYAELKILHKFDEITDAANYTTLPDDWFMIVTDIKGSTKAIEEGRYKEVNFVGAMSIVALLNIAKDVDISFVFGGDVAMLLIPPSLYAEASLALANTRQILITKYEVSEFYIQAIIKGGGLEYGDYLLKNNFEKYSLKTEPSEENPADFNGLECRWEAIPSPKEEVLSLLIKAKDENSDVIYTNVLANIEQILGTSEQRHPIRENNLTLSFDAKKLSVKASLYSKNLFSKALNIMKMMAINLLGKILMSTKIGTWGRHVHFVDGSDGGYALASKALKQRLIGFSS